MPSPTQKDVEASVRACLQIEEARLASEAVFEEFLSPENLRLYREGRLSHVTRLQTNSKVIEPLLRELKTIQPATGGTLLKAVFTSPLPSPSLGLADIAVVTDLETMRGCIEPVPAVQPTWLDILNADWLPFVQKVEAKGVKVTAIQQQFDPPTDRIRINLLINVLGFQSNITVWMEGTMSTKVQLI